jgi:hypothetical protein
VRKIPKFEKNSRKLRGLQLDPPKYTRKSDKCEAEIGNPLTRTVSRHRYVCLHLPGLLDPGDSQPRTWSRRFGDHEVVITRKKIARQMDSFDHAVGRFTGAIIPQTIECAFRDDAAEVGKVAADFRGLYHRKRGQVDLLGQAPS